MKDTNFMERYIRSLNEGLVIPLRGRHPSTWLQLGKIAFLQLKLILFILCKKFLYKQSNYCKYLIIFFYYFLNFLSFIYIKRKGLTREEKKKHINTRNFIIIPKCKVPTVLIKICFILKKINYTYCKFFNLLIIIRNLIFIP